MSEFRKGYLERLNFNGPVSELELLTMMLGNAFGGKDMSELARTLLSRFPSVKAILEADIEEITAMGDVPERVAVYFKTVSYIRRFMPQEDVYLNNSQDCLDFIATRFRGRSNESVEIYFLNKKNKVIEIKTYTTRNASRVDVAASEIVGVIVRTQAQGVYFAHNHVNCPATPSAQDDSVTKKLIAACTGCGKVFYDHCIISSTGDKFSYRQSGKYEALKKDADAGRF